jgi:hypothetical protein
VRLLLWFSAWWSLPFLASYHPDFMGLAFALAYGATLVACLWVMGLR